MQQVLIEVSHQDQVYVEDVCTKRGLSYSNFFKELLDGYKKFGILEEKEEKPVVVENVKETTCTEPAEKESVEEALVAVEEPLKRRGRPPKAK